MCGNQSEELKDSSAIRYYDDVGKVQILNAHAEQELFRRFQETKDPLARELIIKSALRFVIKLAQNYSRDPDMTKDLIAAGNVGLLRAFERYDPSYGTRFLSYATSWVLLEMRNELYNAGIVTMPLWRQKALNKIAQAHARAMKQRGSKASMQELQTCMNLNPNQITRLQACEALCITCLEENDSADTWTSLNRKPLDVLITNKDTRKILNQLIKSLPTVKEQFVIKAYFGWQSDPLSLRNISGVLQVSPERVRQIKVNALRRIRRKLRYQLSIMQSSDLQ